MNTAGTIMIIGGSSGIGLGIARRCLSDGAPVVIAGRSRERLDAARAELGGPGLLTAIPADIGDQA
jgi:short-subunit dehydrogenase involved in D-alanine esterification of teichoic acids